MSENKGNEEKRVEEERRLYEWEKAEKELSPENKVYPLRVTRDNGSQFYTIGHYEGNSSFTYHSADGAIFLEDEIEWLKPASLTPIPSIEGWISVETPPEESGHYWCYVAEQNDLGLSHFQWNCAYSKEDNRWSSNAMYMCVTHWMPLVAPPGETPTKVESISDKEYDK